ncbi:HBL/NHE enterotoxin family protein [Bacillus thuringiensis]|nr:HBL/NHE enterotoxin family protein [Bacillus thuringiensis]
MRKMWISGLIITTLCTNSLNCVNIYAEEEPTPWKNIETQKEMATYPLSNSIRMLGAQSPLIQAYGLVILQQPDIQGRTMSSIANHQQYAKINVYEWMDEYHPRLIDLNQEIMRYSTRFNNYYSGLYELAGKVPEDGQATADFTTAYGSLQKQVYMIQNQIEETLLNFNRYKSLLDKDSQNLSQKTTTTIQSLHESNGDVMQLRADIHRIQDEIQVELANIVNRPQEIIKGSIQIGKQVLTFTNQTAQMKSIDFVSISSLSDEFMHAADSQTREAALRIQQKQKMLLPLVQQLSHIDMQVTEFIFIDDQVKSFAELIGRQILTLENLSHDWHALHQNMLQIQQDLAAGQYTDGRVLQTHFHQLKKSSDELEKQTKQFENYVTQIEAHK